MVMYLLYFLPHCSQRGDYSSEERLCLLLKAKEDNGKAIANSWRKSIREDFKNIAENIVCPFQSPNQALLQFFSENGMILINMKLNIQVRSKIHKFISVFIIFSVCSVVTLTISFVFLSIFTKNI